jgi:rhodanese-related sulfurtransferase
MARNGPAFGGRALGSAMLLLAACLGVAAPAAADAREAREAEGRVVVAAGSPVLLEAGKAKVLVALAPAASLSGIATLRELRRGDRVRYRWRTELAGVRLAEEVVAEPVVLNEAQFTYTEGELAVAFEQGRAPLLVDARPQSAFRGGRIPGARSLPAAAAEGETARAIPADRAAPLVVYAEGPRDGAAHQVARRLVAAGARDVKVLKGGLQEWLEADHPLEIAAGDFRAATAGTPWLVVDVRPTKRLAAGFPAGAVSMPLDAFRWQAFDGTRPFPPILFVGADSKDPAPAELAERVRRLRSARSVKTVMRLHVLAGGFEAWRRAGLPVERGAEPRTSVPFRPVFRAEIDPDEFTRLWQAAGGAGARLLDVRRVGTSGEDWVTKIPLEDLPARLGELPREREIVVICAVGERSHVAAELLLANGFRARFLRAQPAP